MLSLQGCLHAGLYWTGSHLKRYMLQRLLSRHMSKVLRTRACHYSYREVALFAEANSAGALIPAAADGCTTVVEVDAHSSLPLLLLPHLRSS